MNIKQIRLENFKNIENSTITFKNNMSGIYGPNGTGKTAIIEAVELLKKFYGGMNKNDLSSDFFNFIRKGQKTMSIEVIFSSGVDDYKVFIKVQSNDDEEVSVVEEKISLKPTNSRKKFLDIAALENYDNSLIPNIIIGKHNKIEKTLTKSDFGTAIKAYLNCNSCLRQIFMFLFSVKKNNESLYLFFENFYILSNIIDNIIPLTLKKQVIGEKDEEIIIPINCFLENRIYPIKYSQDKNNYNSIESEFLIDTIKEISNLFSVVIPNSKLILEESISGNDELGERKNINLYVEKNGIKVPLTSESTGTIKLVSLLSVLIIYIKNEESTVLIDELDIHIFEYLLAALLETIGPLAKGQLIFTGHNLLPMERLEKDSIIIATKSDNDVVYTFMKGISATTNIRQKYLKSQSYWSEDNIEPLMLNISALELFVKKLML